MDRDTEEYKSLRAAATLCRYYAQRESDGPAATAAGKVLDYISLDKLDARAARDALGALREHPRAFSGSQRRLRKAAAALLSALRARDVARQRAWIAGAVEDIVDALVPEYGREGAGSMVDAEYRDAGGTIPW